MAIIHRPKVGIIGQCRLDAKPALTLPSCCAATKIWIYIALQQNLLYAIFHQPTTCGETTAMTNDALAKMSEQYQ
ncbi:MAG: hypothetical protein KDJ54_04330, partial [Candidatus Competibacteraceae bacterium]|nr:hypothetical protein [Candidatus Competibacteraceae bacterium]